MNNPKKDNPFICFVHIEKCGGITMHNMLHRDFKGYLSPSPEKRFGDEFTLDQFASLIKIWPFKVSGIGGHKVASYQDYGSTLNQDTFTFCFVRDPIARYISHYNWQRLIMKKDWSLESFLEDANFENFQCYRIAGERNFEAAKSELIKNFSFVGLIEDYDRSVLMLS